MTPDRNPTLEPDWTHPRIAVVGAGAVGAYYGGRLTQHGHEVHFLLRSDYAHVARHGWRIRSCHGDFQLPPGRVQVHRDPATMPKADLVLVCLKTVSNDRYEPLIRPLIHDGSVILTLQNGLGNEERLASLFGPGRVMGGMAFVCINRMEPGLIHHIDQGWIQIGDFEPEGISRRAKAIGDLLCSAGIECHVLPSLCHGRWDKLVWNVPFNGLGAALDLTTDKLIGTPAGLIAVLQLMSEVIQAAKVTGVEIHKSSIEKKIEHTRTMGAYRTSMQIDRQIGRPLEVEAIIGEPLRRAAARGVDLPAMRQLYGLVKIVNEANLAGIGCGNLPSEDAFSACVSPSGKL
jgi:2-dehydropantoate 2-reductase